LLYNRLASCVGVYHFITAVFPVAPFLLVLLLLGVLVLLLVLVLVLLLLVVLVLVVCQLILQHC